VQAERTRYACRSSGPSSGPTDPASFLFCPCLPAYAAYATCKDGCPPARLAYAGACMALGYAGDAGALARLGIMEAAVRLGVSTDTIRRRVRKGELPAIRDNHGQWRLDLPDDAAPGVPMQLGESGLVPATLPPAHAATQDAYAGVADALRAQVADLQARLDRAEAREVKARALAEQQGRELTAAVARAAIAEGEARGAREAAAIEVRVVRELLAEARRPAWRRLLWWT